MKSINRYVAILKPRQPYVDWINQLPDTEEKLSIEDLQDDCTAILIPEFDRPEEAKAFISAMAESLFEEELRGWCTDESQWPKGRTNRMFWKWFDVEVHSEVMDAGKGGIRKE
jgi:hypothetical protein